MGASTLLATMADEAPEAPTGDEAGGTLKVGDVVQHKKQRWIGTVARLSEPTQDGGQRVHILWKDRQVNPTEKDANAPSQKTHGHVVSGGIGWREYPVRR